MPGQRKRKRQREAAGRRSATDGPGRWEAVFETLDAAELRDFLRRLSTGAEPVDMSTVRIDMVCGRPPTPAAYRVCLFVPDPT
ncbi:hypothetical protein [Streptomyces sp. BK239]|uniref:hypothetical protein n=1 Tax=Streptomyces sp. BK239 TaxID=2512155 RepID=UPI00102B4E03|nr:hypothetical protein [Streptomyces sp. BK239]RZU18059.1 hypothetical protein EV567_2980 [Streptomyces sp. BK239]